MGKKNKERTKICRRKIKIRLADPNIPDSYVCEVLDSSLENEDEPAFIDYLKPKRFITSSSDEPLKPKNCFDILMSKGSSKKVTNNFKKDIEESSEKAKQPKFNNNAGKEKLTTQTRIGVEVIGSSTNTKETNIKLECSSSSDDESLFVIQKKYKCVQNADNENTKIYAEQDELNLAKVKNEEVICSPKINFTSEKKSLSILNYFTKIETPLTSTTVKVKSNKLNEIAITAYNKGSNKLKTGNDSHKNLSQNEQKKSIIHRDKENVKLAPIFKKKEEKILDVATQKARLEFLFRGLPTVKKPDNIKTSESIYFFPPTCHVQQKSDSVCWSAHNISLPLCKLSNCNEYFFENDKKFHFKISEPNEINSSLVYTKSDTGDGLLNNLKCKYLNLGLELVINGLIEKKDRFLNCAKELEKKSRFTNDESIFETLNTLWTEKYKPRSSEILGNENVVKKLRKWLQSWKDFDEELKSLAKAGKKPKSNESSDNDSDYFLHSDDENYGLKAPGNVCLLSGPNGCGKTSLIFALANELEFSVLEVNASSKRTGKKVLSQLQEATQSHKVHRVNLEESEKFKKETKRKKNKKRKRKKKIEESQIQPKSQSNDCKISLILIEDADIVFEEHDEGFFSAITSLVQTSKRPLIFLTNDSGCFQYENFKAEQCLVLEMEYPDLHKSCAVLETVSILEGGHFKKEAFELLINRNRFDLRKSLLELQFSIISDKNSFYISQSFDLGQYWWGLTKFLYNHDIKHFVKSNERKRKRVNDLFESSDEEDEIEKESFTKKFKLNSKEHIKCFDSEITRKRSDFGIHSYSSILDFASSLDSFRVSNDQEPTPGIEYKPKDSLSLEESIENVSWTERDLTEKIAVEIVSLSTRVFAKKLKDNERKEREICFKFPSWEEIRWRKSQEEASKEIAALVPLQNGRDKKSVHLDYLPIVRNICRVEKNRSTLNTKRKNRFYHYLHNLGVELTDNNLEINCLVFRH